MHLQTGSTNDNGSFTQSLAQALFEYCTDGVPDPAETASIERQDFDEALQTLDRHPNGKQHERLGGAACEIRLRFMLRRLSTQVDACLQEEEIGTTLPLGEGLQQIFPDTRHNAHLVFRHRERPKSLEYDAAMQSTRDKRNTVFFDATTHTHYTGSTDKIDAENRFCDARDIASRSGYNLGKMHVFYSPHTVQTRIEQDERNIIHICPDQRWYAMIVEIRLALMRAVHSGREFEQFHHFLDAHRGHGKHMMRNHGRA